jgi:3-deoxy-D-manno-octulosonic-acid transferase
MYFLYSLLLAAAFLALLPYFVYQAIRNGKYAVSLKQRLGGIPPRKRAEKPTIWIHAVSVGEFLAAQSLIAALRREMPEYSIAVSTTTVTGQQLALKRLGPTNQSTAGLHKPAYIFYFPFDWSFAIRRTMRQLDPAAVIIMETELWPNFLRHCRQLGIPTVVANGRISLRSHKRYSLARRFFARVLGDVSQFIMQSQADADRVLSLGAAEDRVRICGNLKYDVGSGGLDDPSKPGEGKEKGAPRYSESTPGTQQSTAAEIDRLLGPGRISHLIVAGSTASGEEEMVLNALRKIKARPLLSDTRLVLAPRNPERFQEVAALLSRSGFSFVRRSEAGSDLPADRASGSPPLPDVILLDTIGELAYIYRFASVVFVGGSLVPRGGHNIIEPAAYSRPIIVGPHTENFRQVVADFKNASAVAELTGPLQDALTAELIRMLEDQEYAQAIGTSARNLLSRNRGATECTVTAIRSVLEKGGA